MYTWHVIHRFKSYKAAEMVCIKLRQISKGGALFSVQEKEISEHDLKRGVGKFAVCFEYNKQPSFLLIEKMSDACNAALQLALANELAKHDSQNPLLSTWHINPSNIGEYSKYDFTSYYTE